MLNSTSFSNAIGYFKDSRLVFIFLFGIASGFPWVMIGSAMSGWLKDEGLSRSSIGLFGLIFAVYSVNFLWASLVERVKLPLLGRLLGQRRSWIILTQSVIVCTCAYLYQLDAKSQLATVALVGFILALASATQDIAIDAYRIDIVGTNNSNLMSAASAMATTGWWTGFAGLGAIPFFLADLPNWQWHQAYLVLAGIMAVLMITVFFAKEPENNRQATHKEIEQSFLNCIPKHNVLTSSVLVSMLLIMGLILVAGFKFPALTLGGYSFQLTATSASIVGIALILLFARQLSKLHAAVISTPENQAPMAVNRYHKSMAWLLVTLVSPIHEFFKRNGTRFAISVLLFIFLFKIGEAYLGRMSIVFYKEVGYSNTDIGIYSKMVNWWVTIVFSIIGSVFNIKYGILRGLFIGGIAMALSNLLFAVIAVVGPNKAMLAFTVFVDGFTSAWGSVAFVALLSVLCNKAFTASQYALMASLGTFGRVMLGSYSGIFVDWLDGNWAVFFIITSVMVIPSLIFLYSIRKPLQAIIDKNNRENTC